MKDYDTWARKMKNNLILCSIDGSTVTAWIMSGGTALAPAAGNAAEIACEMAIREALDMWATAMIESTLLDHMIC
jgi:hypothetical protein